MMIKTMKHKLISPLNIFVLITLISAGLYLIYAYSAGAESWYWLAMSNVDDRFYDFRIHVAFVADRHHLYSRMNYDAGCFPPLSYCMYYFFFKIFFRPEIPDYRSVELFQLDFFSSIILYYTIAVVLLMYFALTLYAGNEHRKACALFFVSVLLSVPGYECLMIGNSVLLVMVMLLLACKLRDSDSAVLREMALILIAVAAGFKIYPAIMGFLYLKERRFREAIRLTIYGIILFFGPFAFFGGAEGFRLWLDNVVQTMGMMDLGRIQCIREMIYSLVTWAGYTLADSIYSIISIGFVLLMLVFAWFTGSGHRRLFYLCAIMIFFPSSCCRYTLCFLVIPLATWFFDEPAASDSPKGISIPDLMEVILYTGVYAIPMLWGFITRFEWNYGYYMLTYVEVWIYVFAYSLLIFNIARDVVAFAMGRGPARRSHKLNQS